jgi:hypothetical protein
MREKLEIDEKNAENCALAFTSVAGVKPDSNSYGILH